MHLRLLKTRAGFTLAETLVAMVLTAVVGVAVTSLFVTQSRFYDRQEKVSFARGGARGSMNLMMSEMRMIEQTQGVHSAALKAVTVNVPYRLGIACSSSIVGVVALALPVDASVTAENAHTGFSWRLANGSYAPYRTGNVAGATTAQAATCRLAGDTIQIAGGTPLYLAALAPGGVVRGQPVLLFKRITYEFKNSVQMPGRVALWRTLEGTGAAEEIAGPFHSSAGFRYYSGTPPVLHAGIPALGDIRGIRIDLNAVSERPETDGTYVTTPLSTSVYFRNQ